MKKLLSLLSIITISGTAIPTTIAASPYQNDKTKLENSKINYSQTNNLEILNRKKREKKYIKEFLFRGNNIHLFNGNNLSNEIYYGSNDFNGSIYKYNLSTGKNEILLKVNSSLGVSGCVFNNKIYYSTQNHDIYDGVVHEYDLNTKTENKILEASPPIISLLFPYYLDNKIYVQNWYKQNTDEKYEYNPVTKETKTVLKKINPINSIKLKNNKEVTVESNNVYIYDSLELIESDINDMTEHVKKGLYLQYKKQNPNSEIKNILNINLKNLKVSDIAIEQTQKNKSLNSEQDLNDVCKDSNSTFINNSSIEQTQNTISCSKQLTETNTFQKMNGFSKSETTSNTDNWSANVNTKVTAKASGSAGIPLVAEGKVEVGVEVGAGYTWGKSKTYTVGDTSNSSDTEIKTTTNTTTITVPSQPVKVPPHSKISISVTSWQNNINLILNYYQKVEGVVNADFIDKNDNKTIISISIKQAMLNLLENKILPSKIKINNDDSINFSYNIKTEKQIIMHQTEIGETIPLSLYEQNETFKDNKTSIIVLKN